MSWKLADVEKNHIIVCLCRYDWNRTKTAKALGIGLRTLQRKIRKYGLTHIRDAREFHYWEESQAYAGSYKKSATSDATITHDNSRYWGFDEGIK